MIRKRHIPKRTLEQELSNAVTRESTQNTEALLAKGADPLLRYDRNPILFDASLPNLRVLFHHGVNVNVPAENGMTLLSYLCATHQPGSGSYDHRKKIEFILENGADPLLADANGDTPLHHLCLQSLDPVVVRLLLEHGADPNQTNSQEDTPLHLIAIHSGIFSHRPRPLRYQECIQILLNAGANPLMENEDGFTPSQYAEENEQPIELVRVLRQRERNAGSTLEMPVERPVPPPVVHPPNGYHNYQNMFNGGRRKTRNKHNKRKTRSKKRFSKRR